MPRGHTYPLRVNDSIDHIFCKDGFEHQQSTEHFLRETSRALRPGGTLEIWVPHFKNPSAYRITHRHLFSWSCFNAFPEPHDAVQDLQVIVNRLHIGHFKNVAWRVVDCVANLAPKWWERLCYVSNLQVVLKQTKASGE